jgi:ATP-dependent DNA helicase RecG
MPPRADCDKLLDEPVVRVRAVSANRAKLLSKMGIESVRDLLTCYPNRYIDLTAVYPIATAPLEETVTVIGTVDEVTRKQPRPRLDILEVGLVDETGVMLGVWFRQPWMANRFEKGMRVALSGKVTFDYGFKRMNSPFVEVLGPDGERGGVGMIPVHPATEGLSSTWMRRFIANALEQCADCHDPLPASLRAARGLVSRKRALRDIHFPATAQAREQARRRLAYEEALRLQLVMLARRAAETAGAEPFVQQAGAYTRTLGEQLPFTLTDEQRDAIQDIAQDMAANRCMNRMLLGDVGTGKTAVAAFALAIAADAGHQGAMMAPTEVLARQYAAKLGPLFEACGMSWGILTGSTGAAERAELLEALAHGGVDVVFGTHALIEPDVVFSDLSLVVIDEQHRFGVKQRAALREKGPGSDLLVMTATPIPRSLALTLYGDLSTSYIRKRPVSRPETTTQVVSRDARGVAYDAIRAAVAQGRQAYIICPLVGLSREQRAKRSESGEMQLSLSGGSDISDPKAAEDEAQFLARKVFPQYTVGLLTGHMGATEKRAVMDAFHDREIDILVATTVVEVGVDVPNATVMMVEDAERFGLSQLHQLRGRVGRGEYPGQVFLVADPGKDDTDAQARMDALVSTNDGFALAEADLKARREGDVLGSRQHGAETLKLVNVVDDAELIALAHDDALRILADDPALSRDEHVALAHELETVFSRYDDTASEGA